MNITTEKIKSLWPLDKRRTKTFLGFAATALFWGFASGKLFPKDFLLDFLVSTGPLFLALAYVVHVSPKKKPVDKEEAES